MNQKPKKVDKNIVKERNMISQHRSDQNKLNSIYILFLSFLSRINNKIS